MNKKLIIILGAIALVSNAYVSILLVKTQKELDKTQEALILNQKQAASMRELIREELGRHNFKPQ